MLNNYICTLDIGSTKISACVAQMRKKRLENIFFESMPSRGIKDGIIVDSIDAVNCIGKTLKNLKTKSGINIKFVYTGISGQDIVTKHSRAIIPLAERGNKVITVSDIQRVNEQARVLGSSLEEEIVQRIPYSYSIDSKNNIANPLGLYSHRLEADLYLICAKLSSVQTLSRVINQSGYEIKELFFSGLATAKAVMHNEYQEGLNLFCDIGADVTELLVFKDGFLKDVEIIPLGGNNLNILLQEELKIPAELAEDIKRSHGLIAENAGLDEDKEILVKKNTLYKPIKQKLVVELITAGAKSICARIRESVEKKVSVYEVNNFVVSGRTILLEGFIEMLENNLEMPVKLGRIRHPQITPLVKEEGELSGQKYLTYLTALGMLAIVLEDKPVGLLPMHQPAKNLVIKALNRFKEVYQEYF